MTETLEPGLLERLGGILEPDLRVPLVKLNMLKVVKSGWGKSQLKLVTLNPSPEYANELEAEVTKALESGPKAMRVVTEVASAEELEEIASSLVDVEGTAAAAARLERKPPVSAAGSKTRVIGISSGKGGVGKSSVCVNLAVALAGRGHEVGILDADVYGFSVPKMLGITRKPQLIGNLMIPPVGFGVRCMSMGFFVEDDTPVVWRGPMLHKALEQFLVDVFWGDLDYLIIDMPPGTGDVALSLGEYLPKSEIMVVTTPQPAAERVAQRSALAARKLKLPVRGVIENMSHFVGDDGKIYEIFGSGGGAQLAEVLSVPLLARLPIDMKIRQGGDVGTPSAAAGEAGGFEDLAKAIEDMGPARRYRSELKIT